MNRSESDERTAITAVVAALQQAQRHEDVDAFVRLFRADAIWTTGHGRRLTGRDEIAAFTAEVLPGATAESAASYEVVHILFIRPDVAAVKVRQRATTLDGVPIEGANEGSPVYVMARENGDWLLVAGQNTEVLPA
jgi:uncharacterized protein (TIGR02246 family)